MLRKLLDRYMWVVDLAIIALLATFLASGVDQLLSAAIHSVMQARVEHEAWGAEPGGEAAGGPAEEFEPVDGKRILRRNIFDSVTGPLDKGSALSEEMLPEEEELVEGEEEALPPRCDDPFHLKATYASPEHPSYSFVAIREGSETMILQLGDTLGDYTLEEITWRYALLGSEEKATCYLDVWDSAPKRRAKKPKHGKRGGAKSSVLKLQSMIDKSIRDVSPTEKDVDRSLVSYLEDNKHLVMKSGRLLPNVKGKKVNGFKLYGIRKSSLWGKLGIHNGDVLLEVNGQKMNGPKKAFDVFSSLEDQDRAEVTIKRHGKPVTLTWNIK